MKSFFITLIIIIFCLELHAQPGTLDYTFGDSGKVISTFYEGEIRASALQPGGKIVVGGLAYYKNDIVEKGALLERYNQDGSLDFSFGNNGKTSYNLGDTTHQKSVTALVVQNDKRIVMAGIDASSAAHIFLMGVNDDGSIDEGFGEKGFTLTKISRDDYPADMTLLPDGRIAVTGQTQEGINDNSRGFLALYTSDGKLDKNFGDTGITIIQLSSPMYITAMAITKEGKIIIGGNYIFINKTFLLGYNNDGTPDKSFGVNGIENTSFYAQDQGASLLIQKDGKIVLSGNSYIPFPQDKTPVALARYNGDDSKKQIIVMKIKRWLQHHGISWQTDNNVRYYTVQRSTDGGITYQPVAKFYNSKTFYNYEDAAQTANTCYRVAITAKDGGRLVSNTVFINEGSQASIYPNPVHGTLQLQSLPTDSKTSISIVDFNGNVRTTATASGGSISVNTSSLKPGNYLLRLQHNNNITTQTFVKE